jgi:G:T-mismatch repair DNA endonuclease (very short patch repair protein)
MGHTLSLEARQKIGDANRKRIISPETRQKISNASRGRTYSLETLQRIRNANKKKVLSLEARQKMSNTNRLRILNPETLQKMRDSAKRRCQNPEELLRLLKQGRKLSKPNKAELKLYSILEDLFPGHYKLNTRCEIMTLGGKIPDIVNTNNQKKVLELFGDFWHKDDNPDDRIALFRPLGWDALVIWESELKDRPALEARLQEFHARPHLEMPNAAQ